MNLMIIDYPNKDCDTCKNDCPIIIESDYPSLLTIPGGNVVGTSFTVSSIILNTSCLRNPCIKIDFASNVFFTDFDETIIFQVFKRYNNQSFPVGPGWPLSSTISSATIFSFFVYDHDYCNTEYCTYILVATIQ